MNIVDSFQTPKYFIPGYGYSASSGSSVGGGPNFIDSPSAYATSFYGDDLRQLFPITPTISLFGAKRRASKRTRASKRRASKRRSKRRASKRNGKK